MDLEDETVYSWLAGKSGPAEPELITAFLDSLPGGKVRNRAGRPRVPRVQELVRDQAATFARFAGRRKARFKRSEAAFKGFARIAALQGRSGRAKMKR